MNKHDQLSGVTKGFTIIEVVLVLAIAGLIFLMVFIALPALQGSQRDAQRKNDLSRIATQLSNYKSSNRGKIPAMTGTNSFASGTNSFARVYLEGSANNQASDDTYADPSTGEGYVLKVISNDSSNLGNSFVLGDINYQTGRICDPDNGGGVTSASGRNYALRMKLEGQTVPYCLDNS